MTKFSIPKFLEEQFAVPVSFATTVFFGMILVVTGTNSGLGFEATQNFASMNPGTNPRLSKRG